MDSNNYIIFSSRGISVIAFVLFIILDFSNGLCIYVDWQPEEMACPNGYLEAYHERKLILGRQMYFGMCCNDQRSYDIERLQISHCRTSDCISNSRAGQNNTCAQLAQVYMDDQPFNPEYEEVFRESCGSKKVTGVCCPRNTYAALHMTVSAAEKNEFPHMVAIPGCGATVYNKDFVITAAHCLVDQRTGRVRNLRNNPMRVRIGTNIGDTDASENVYNVRKIIVHQNYSLRAEHPEFARFINKRLYNDIALLELERSIDFDKNRNIKALKIAPAYFNAEDFADQVMILGWGTSEMLTTTQHLQKSNLLIRSDSMCFDKRQGKLGRNQYDIMEHADQLLCIGGIVGESVSNEAGRGDSGGPAICRDEDGFAVLCGVTSFGSEYPEEYCVQNQDENYCKPSVYADVSHFREWIIDNAGEQNSSTFYKVKLYGDEVEEGQYIHQVHLQTEDGKSCGGTLVSQDTVVTAAHCVLTDDQEERSGIKVYFVDDVNKRHTRSKMFRVPNGNVKYPPGFSRYTNLDSLNNTKAKNRIVIKDSAYNDNIAVIKLSKRVNISPRQLPKLPDKEKFKTGRAVELAFPSNTSRGGRLMSREFNILEQKECRRRLDRFRAINVQVKLDTSKVMCGVEKFSGGSICDREIGGALMCRGDDGYNLFCGVQTFRMCEMTLPSAFLNVGKHIKLIESVINSR